MSNSPRNPDAPEAASVSLVERVKAPVNDDMLLRETDATSVSVADAFAVLLAGSSCYAPTGAKLQKARNRPLPAETFVEVVLFADRDTLDAMQLTCSALFDMIKERELTKLALRTITEVIIGRHFWKYSDDLNYWIPSAEIVYGHGDGKMSVPKAVHQLAFGLRMTYCESVCIDFMSAPGAGPRGAFINVCGMVFDEMLAPNTFVGTLHIHLSRLNVMLAAGKYRTRPSRKQQMVLGGIGAFKSVKNVCVESAWSGGHVNESFLVTAVQRGVRHIELKSRDALNSVNTSAALLFGFADPTTGGERVLLGVVCGIGADFLAQVKQKVSELDGGSHVDFKFKLSDVSSNIDSAGFEKYQKDGGRTWLMDDLENRVSVAVKQTENLVEIHVFSSV